MKRGIIVLSICSVITIADFTASKWAIHHKTLTFVDPLRSDRTVTVDLAVRRDREMESIAEMIDLPVAILSHGNTVKNTEYSFLANVFAARGYMVVSIQHDLETDDPVFTADPGVVSSDEICAKAGIEVVRTEFQHNQLSDRGPDNVKAAIQAKVQAFLDEDEGVSPIPFLSAAAPDRVAATAPAKK